MGIAIKYEESEKKEDKPFRHEPIALQGESRKRESIMKGSGG